MVKVQAHAYGCKMHNDQSQASEVVYAQTWVFPVICSLSCADPGAVGQWPLCSKQMRML